jgi:ribosomal protein S17E
MKKDPKIFLKHIAESIQKRYSCSQKTDFETTKRALKKVEVLWTPTF